MSARARMRAMASVRALFGVVAMLAPEQAARELSGAPAAG